MTRKAGSHRIGLVLSDSREVDPGSGRQRPLLTSEPSQRDEWGTPPEIFRLLDDRYRFTVDACADEGNAKLARYWSLEENGLSQDWTNERAWCNPPYSQISWWIAKGPTALVAAYILPTRTGVPWWHHFALRSAEIIFLRGRVAFVPPAGVRPSSGTEDSCLVIFRRGHVGPPQVRGLVTSEIMELFK